MNDFRNYAVKHRGIASLHVDKYTSAVNDYLTPYIIEERPMNITQLDVFSRLMKDRIIFLGVPIDDDVANIIEAQLLFLESQDSERDIQIYLNTPGGYVHAGLGIYDTMQYIKCDVSTICIGMAASMGAFLLSAGTKGKRLALPNSEIMIHQPLGGASGQATDVAIRAEWLLKTKEKMTRLTSEMTGQDIEKVKQDVERDYFMSAKEALDYGIIDEIYQPRNAK